MNKEALFLVAQFRDAFEGDPWFGRPGLALLNEVNEDIAFERLNGQHSIVELIWHMINWKEFAINCLRPDSNKNLNFFEENDWRELDLSDKSLLQQGMIEIRKVQDDFLKLLQEQQDHIFENKVPGRAYTFRKLLHGVLQHDIYHLGQIAFIKKVITNQ
jgi:uncharacterized damage-inducible protein DinB